MIINQQPFYLANWTTKACLLLKNNGIQLINKIGGL